MGGRDGSEVANVDHIDLLRFRQPVALQNWFSAEYVRGLPPEIQEEFSAMLIKDFLGPVGPLLARDFVVQLDGNTRRALAYFNYMIATKL